MISNIELENIANKIIAEAYRVNEPLYVIRIKGQILYFGGQRVFKSYNRAKRQFIEYLGFSYFSQEWRTKSRKEIMKDAETLTNQLITENLLTISLI